MRIVAPLLLAGLALTGCSVVPPRDDLNAALGDLGAAYKSRDPERVLRLYAEDLRASSPLTPLEALDAPDEEGGVRVWRSVGVADRSSFRADLERGFARLGEVTKAKFVLDDVVELEDGAWQVDSHSWLYAATADGGLIQETSNWVFVFAPGEDGVLRIREQRLRDRTVARAAAPMFVERAAEVGLAGEHRRHTPIGPDTPVVPGNFSGSGASAGDLDDDGDLDLVIGDGERSRVYLNRGDGTFEEATDTSGLGEVGKVRGAYLVDVDGDARLDILFTCVKRSPRLFRNLGGARFEERTADLGEVPPGQYESAAFGDLDGDGDLDLYLVRYGDFETSSWAYPIYAATDGVTDVVLENLGDGTFREVLEPSLQIPGWGLAVALADYDDDGDQDIYIVNDFGVNHLLRNEGGWKFTDVTEQAGVSDQGFGMSASFGDYDGDGTLDIYVANMNSSSRWVFQDPNFPLPAIADLFFRDLVREEMHRVTRGNSLFKNMGDGTFTQVAGELGCERAQWAWGADFCDFDNDGDLDIYCPNGYITGPDVPDM